MTVLARVCIDMLRFTCVTPPGPGGLPAESPTSEGFADPEEETLLGDSVGMAWLVVLETLTPAERVAFVFTICSTCRSMRSHRSWSARRPPRASSPAVHVGAYGATATMSSSLAVGRSSTPFSLLPVVGIFEALLALLDPDAKLNADHTAVERVGAARAGIRGASAVAGLFVGRALWRDRRWWTAPLERCGLRAVGPVSYSSSRSWTPRSSRST
jgi:RNA polymerase sigma-70 factor (ECF subfamily)